MIVVVGGAGYIGSVTVEELVERGRDVLVIDDLSLGHEWAVPDGVRLVQTDMADTSAIESIARDHEVEAVMHFAALAKVGESMEQPHRYWKQNLVKSIRMFETWLEHGIDRFIFSSTAAVYGEPEEIPITEDHPTNPINPYGRTKRAVEWYLEDLHRNQRAQSVCLRYFNAAGAGTVAGEAHAPETHLIPIVLETAKGQRDHVEMYGTDYPTKDGTCLRDFIHVKDLADAHIKAVDRIETLGCERINLGTGKGNTVREVIETIQAVTDKQFEVREAEPRPGDPARLVASRQKATALLDWSASRSLRDIIKDAWEWKKNHQPNSAQKTPN